MRRSTIGLLWGLILISAVEFPGRSRSASAADNDRDGIEFFEKKVRPVLISRCYKCHSTKAKKLQGGLLLDSRTGMRKGGESGAAVVAGKPDASLLFQAISHADDVSEMPPDGKLPDKVIADFRKWILIGAPAPGDGKSRPNSDDRSNDIERGRKFWSFRPAVETVLPDVSQQQWPRTRIDYFVLGKLEAQQMQPAEEADRRTLLRRVTMDLTGLPPTFEDVESFSSDASPDAYDKLVDRLLASPRYGERWGRHWLDVARYAEDNPTSESTCKPPRFPFRYRDWVIEALNKDVPYDEFVKRQLAADLMDVAPSEIAALGFLGLSPVYHKEPKLSKDVISVIVADEWDERLDTITRGFLGLTVACARCHDHKFDPITVEDYYALAGVLASTQLVEWPIVETDTDVAEALTETRRQIVDHTLRLSYAKTMRNTAAAKQQDTRPFEKAAAEFESTLKQLKNRTLFDGPIANAVRDAAWQVNGDDPAWTILDFTPGAANNLPIFIRGSVTNPGRIVPRRFIEVLSREPVKPFGPGSGRLELAERIVDDAGSLAARVIVNRVWGWHFGAPLVATPSNFGQLGERPSHPELLDDLAVRFINQGWSLKWLHREIVLSAAYRQASRHNAEYHNRDPDNRLLWRMNRRRLEAEVWRDAVLSVTGQLDDRMGGPSQNLDKLDNRRRTVYGTISRQRPADVLRLFDFPDAKRHSDRRLPTTTPLQQLYLLNSAFLGQQATALVNSFVDDTDAEPLQITRELFRKILLRNPTRAETASALQLIDADAGTVPKENWVTLAHGLLASNEFLFVD